MNNDELLARIAKLERENKRQKEKVKRLEEKLALVQEEAKLPKKNRKKPGRKFVEKKEYRFAVGNDGKKVQVFPQGNMVYVSKDGRVFFAERVNGKFVWAESELDQEGEERKQPEKWYALTFDRCIAINYDIIDEDDGTDEWLEQAVENGNVIVKQAKAIRLFKAVNRREADEQIAEFLNVAQRRADGDNIPPNIVRLKAVSVQENVEYHGDYDPINQPMFAGGTAAPMMNGNRVIVW